LMSDTIRRQTASYRQGLVLGLTMAEIMLLLVFCLLIAVGVALSSERAKLDAAEGRLQRLEASAGADHAIIDTIRRNAELAEILDRTGSTGSAGEIDQFWRKLVESNDVVTKMEREGIPLAALEQNNDSAAKLRQLMRDGIDPEKLARGVALASAVDAAVAERNMSKLTPQEIVALIEKSLTPAAPTESSNQKGHTWPPIINLSEADGYFFAVGSAELTQSFATELRGAVTDRLLEIAKTYDVDVIEVIGHTDEQPVASHVSNLDRKLASVTSGENGIDSLQWSDNAGLGLARALSVVQLLSTDPRLQRFRILPLSAAQLIGTDGRLTHWDDSGDVRERRRIEIRMRKSI
jgi:outer membrane protein OmpA-like peptidoglycan-associated protein